MPAPSIAASNAGTAAATNTCTVSITPSGVNRALLIKIAPTDGSPPAISSVVFNGSENASSLADELQAGLFIRNGWWVLIAPSAVTADVVVTLAASSSQWGVIVEAWQGVDQTTPFGSVTFANGTGVSPDPTVTASGASGTNTVTDFLVRIAAAQTVGADQTQVQQALASGITTLAASTQLGSSGGVMSWTDGGSGTVSGWEWVLGAAVANEPTASAEVDQSGYRFGIDDGSEAAHTWAEAQGVGIYATLGSARLLRVQLDATGDPASKTPSLRYQKNGAGGFVAVPVGSSVPEVFGTVTFGAIGTGANGSTTVAPSYPAGITAGQYLVCVVTSGATNSETPTTPSGWTLLATDASTDGTYGVDTGPRRVTAFGKIADGTETGTLTVSITNGGTCRGTISRFTKSGAGAWDVQAQGGNDSTSGTGVSIAFASMNWNTGDAVLVATGQRVDSATQSAQSLTATGVTFGTRTNRAATAVTTGNDHRHSVDTFAAVSSTSDVDAAPTWAYTASAAASAGGVIVRLREYTAPVANELYIATSANIAAGGESTTARLTAPSGKSTGDFIAGRRWDDENGTDALDLAVDDYSELEWSIAIQAPAVDGDVFEFRVYDGATALDTYTFTPTWTIGTPPQPNVLSMFRRPPTIFRTH